MIFEIRSLNKLKYSKIFLIDILFWPNPFTLVCIHFDSHDTIGRTWNMMYNGKSRHLEHIHDTVRKLLSSEIIRIDYVKSKENVLDPLTKRLTKEKV